MRPPALAVCAAAAIALSGCGYVGDPLPPALNIPARIDDLKATQRGDRILITFSLPELTTEGLPVERLSGVDLRIGPTVTPFRHDLWAPGTKAVDVKLTGEQIISASAAASDWYGQSVAIGVRLINQKGRESEWSNVQTVDVAKPPAAPSSVRAESHPQGVRVIWTAGPGTGVRYRVWRRTPKQETAELAATVDLAEFIDAKVESGSEYSYRVQALAGEVESEYSAEVSVLARDVMAPAAPTGVSAVGSLSTVELNWQRGAESDVAEYRVYRAEGDGEFTQAAQLKETAWSDKQVVSGRSYRYAVTAIDRAGNESSRSQIVTVTAP